MADLDMSVQIGRANLGLPNLEVADGDPYYVATQFLGAAVAWTRQQASSPFLDGQITTSRMRANVVEQIGIEIKATTLTLLQTYMTTLLQAFTQSRFTMAIRIGSTHWSYHCEAADYQSATWNTPRMVSQQGQIVFSVPRQPVAVTGGM